MEDYTSSYDIELASNPKTGEKLNLSIVMASFLEEKAKEHKCRPEELSIGYYQGEAYLYKTYIDHQGKTRTEWEQDILTGEMVTDN